MKDMKKILLIGGLFVCIGMVNVVRAQGSQCDSLPAGPARNSCEAANAGAVSDSSRQGPDSSRTGLDSLNLNEGQWNALGPGVTTIEGLLKRIIDWLIVLAAPIAAGMVVYGAYQMLFAAGEPEKVKTGRNTILYTVVGYGIILISWGVVSIVENFLKGA